MSFFAVNESTFTSPFQSVITGQGMADATIRGENAAIKKYNEFVHYSNTNYIRQYKLFELAGKDNFEMAGKKSIRSSLIL